MKRTAGFLKLCCTIGLVFEVIIAVMIAFADGIILAAGKLSELAAKAPEAISIQGGSLTPQEMDALKPFILIALTAVLLSLILTIVGTLKTRAALGECKEERPFSQKCVNSLKISARMELFAGLVAIIGSGVLAFMASNLKVNGVAMGSSSVTVSLSFLIYAALKYLLYHVAEYGNSLERDPRRR